MNISLTTFSRENIPQGEAEIASIALLKTLSCYEQSSTFQLFTEGDISLTYNCFEFKFQRKSSLVKR